MRRGGGVCAASVASSRLVRLSPALIRSQPEGPPPASTVRCVAWTTSAGNTQTRRTLVRRTRRKTNLAAFFGTNSRRAWNVSGWGHQHAYTWEQTQKWLEEVLLLAPRGAAAHIYRRDNNQQSLPLQFIGNLRVLFTGTTSLCAQDTEILTSHRLTCTQALFELHRRGPD